MRIFAEGDNQRGEAVFRTLILVFATVAAADLDGISPVTAQHASNLEGIPSHSIAPHRVGTRRNDIN